MSVPQIKLMTRMTIPVRREGRITWENGIAQASDVREFLIKGLIVPLSGRELLLVPEADRFKVQIWVFTQDNLQDNDLVVHRGVNYAVQIIEPWTDQFIRARAMRMDVGPERGRG